MVVLGPATIDSASFGNVETASIEHDTLLAEAQRLRGRVYLEDGAIAPSQLSRDERFIQPDDDQSWHLLILNAGGQVAGCARFRSHRSDTQFANLGVAQAALAHCSGWDGLLQRAVQGEMAAAAKRRIHFVECGGWALAKELRGSTEALRMALCMFALARLFGGAIGVTTATTRHHSSQILRKIGGRPLQLGEVEIPRYYDPQYNCDMEVLRFDSSMPCERFEDRIQQCEFELSQATVLHSQRASHRLFFRSKLRGKRDANPVAHEMLCGSRTHAVGGGVRAHCAVALRA